MLFFYYLSLSFLCPLFACCPLCVFRPPTFLQRSTPTWGSMTRTDHGIFALWTPGQRASTQHRFTNCYRVFLLLVPPPTPWDSSESADHPRARETAHWESWVGECTWRMAVFWKAMAGGLLLTFSLTLLGWGAEGQGNGRGKVCSWIVHWYVCFLC